MILIEERFENITPVMEATREGAGKRLYLKGVFAEAETANQNGRRYRLDEMKTQVDIINDKAAKREYVLGELDHPSILDIKLKNVSHKIVEMWMVGNQAHGKAEIIESHPNGQILKSLIEHDIRVGVSTRGSGQVNESTGEVNNFRLVTVDAVATPSARSAFPETIEEQLQMAKNGVSVQDLAEAVIHDEIAQKYFQIEMRKFINEVFRTK